LEHVGTNLSWGLNGEPSDRTGKDIKARVEEGQGVPFFDERFSCREVSSQNHKWIQDIQGPSLEIC